MHNVKKIVIIGPESTGKSTLCSELAAHFNTIYCPEYARAFLIEHGINYSYTDLLTIAKGQLNLEDEYVEKVVNVNSKPKTQNSEFLFIDTDMYVMKVWCEFVFDKCHQWILDQITNRSYDLYLLCKPDLPWIKDTLREYPDEKLRIKLYHYYRDLLVNQSTPWVEISGSYKERLQTAIKAVEAL